MVAWPAGTFIGAEPILGEKLDLLDPLRPRRRLAAGAAAAVALVGGGLAIGRARRCGAGPGRTRAAGRDRARTRQRPRVPRAPAAGRDRSRRRPPACCPASSGTLLDEVADPRDVTATIVDLAVRGYLDIRERPEADGALDAGADGPGEDWELRGLPVPAAVRPHRLRAEAARRPVRRAAVGADVGGPDDVRVVDGRGPGRCSTSTSPSAAGSAPTRGPSGTHWYPTGAALRRRRRGRRDRRASRRWSTASGWSAARSLVLVGILVAGAGRRRTGAHGVRARRCSPQAVALQALPRDGRRRPAARSCTARTCSAGTCRTRSSSA